MTLALLQSVPDLNDWAGVSAWVERTLDKIVKCDFATAADSFQMVTFPGDAMIDPVLGPYGSADWRRFALSVFLADWACYTHPADRGDFARLMSIVAAFPQGFRVYFANLNDGTPVPVGYTGWYPITADMFNVLHDRPHQITHRGFMVPLKELAAQDNYIYLFNYSIIDQLRKTAQSSQLIKGMVDQIKSVAYKGLGAVTVSEDGIRIAEQFGMRFKGDITHDGETESAYCLRVSADHNSSQPNAKTLAISG
jgi:hypothetical protein